MKMLLAALPLLAMAGCSSFSADPEHVTQVPSDRLLAYQQPLEGGGQIIVNRDIGMLGGGCYVAVLIDRQVAARIGIGEQARFEVPAGSRIVGIGIDEQDDTLCGMGRLNRELALELKPGEREQFRIVSEASSGFSIKPEAK
ncbi:hypothetical protein D9M71_243880 [compost metagenome]